MVILNLDKTRVNIGMKVFFRFVFAKSLDGTSDTLWQWFRGHPMVLRMSSIEMSDLTYSFTQINLNCLTSSIICITHLGIVYLIHIGFST